MIIIRFRRICVCDLEFGVKKETCAGATETDYHAADIVCILHQLVRMPVQTPHGIWLPGTPLACI